MSFIADVLSKGSIHSVSPVLKPSARDWDNKSLLNICFYLCLNLSSYKFTQRHQPGETPAPCTCQTWGSSSPQWQLWYSVNQQINKSKTSRSYVNQIHYSLYNSTVRPVGSFIIDLGRKRDEETRKISFLNPPPFSCTLCVTLFEKHSFFGHNIFT